MYALVDCNNFFVSCERVFRPDLEGKAVVVLSNNDGCVVARSNESKALGIRMCTPFYQVRHLVDSGKLVAFSSNYALYADMSSRVMSILASAVPKIEIYSIDEAFLVMDGIPDGQIPSVCSRLVSQVRQWVGIPVSIGVAPTKTLAKVASHFAKKYPGYRGVCMIDSEEKRTRALSLTPIGEVWGVGRRNVGRMEECGIRTALDFAMRPEEWVGRKFLLHGRRMWKELNGVPCVAEELPEKRKSICTSRSFAVMLTDEMELASHVAAFASKCAAKLREEKSAAMKVTVFLWTNRFRDDLGQYYPSVTVCLPVAANSSQEIVGAAMRGLKTIFREGYQYKKAGVIVDDIVDDSSVQPALFGYDMERRGREDTLSRIMDSMNAGGRNILRLASCQAGEYSSGIRSEHRSPRYSTVFSEILEVR